MTATVRKYNPGFLTDDELVALFCVRTEELESMVETLRECTGNANTHQIVIGPRGSGKTSLLLRVAAEICRDQQLSSRFFPVVFSEESYEVTSAGEFWLECLSRLADQAPRGEDGPDMRLTYDDLRPIQDDRTLGNRCLGVLQDFADREGKRLVLIVENLNMLLGDIGDEDMGWQLRHTLQTEPRIVLLASATSRFDEIDNREQALYDLFRELSLRPLDRDDCATLWQTVSGQRRAPETIQALRILTGGSPRLLTIMARFGANLSFRDLMADLLNLVDDHTEYFKSHLDGLPAQERKVYLALLHLWKPVTAREVADRARLDTNRCSALLKRLTERGVVEVAGGTDRRKLYCVVERLYNIYYLMRRARGRVSLIEALIRFMEAQYSPSELKDFVIRTVREAVNLDGEAKWMHQIASDRLLESPSLSAHREELRALKSWIRPFASDDAGEAEVLVSEGIEIANRGHVFEAMALWDEVIRRLKSSNSAEDLVTVAAALNNKGMALHLLRRGEKAVAVWDEVVRRFGSSQVPEHISAAAIALSLKVFVLRDRGQTKEALAVCEELLQCLEQDSAPRSTVEIAGVHHALGLYFRDLDRPEKALRIWDELVQHCGESDDPEITEQVGAVLQNKGALLVKSNRLTEALATWDDVIERFGVRGSSADSAVVAIAMTNKGTTLLGLNRIEEALEVWAEVVERFGASESPSLLPMVAGALVGKGTAFENLNRLEEALEVWDEVLALPACCDDPTNDHPFVVALTHRSLLLDALGQKQVASAFKDEAVQRLSESDEPRLVLAAVQALARITTWLVLENRFQEALAAWDEIVRRFGRFDTPIVLDAMAHIFVNKGKTLARMNQLGEALAIWEDVVRRFGSSDTAIGQAAVAESLVCRGNILADLNRPQEALDAMNDVIRRFGSTTTPSSLRTHISTALLGKARTLTSFNRLQEAVAVYKEVLDRHRGATTPDSVGSIALDLFGKGAVLVRLNQSTAALTNLESALWSCGTSDHPMLQHGAEFAQLKIAELQLAMGRGDKAVAAADHLFEPVEPKSPEIGCQGHLTRARAHLLQGDKTACMVDVETALTILSELDSLPNDVLDGLYWLAVEMGPAQLRELILASPAASTLFPLTTALEKELGLETRVAKEVEEVADDVQRGLEERRRGGWRLGHRAPAV
ncbi:MAG: tetratricopeptide repeat protein [Rhodobacteraceae bacterium]|nr:tetratricopeptide repeat protein [Paracoccaceae bacterium]MCY4141064.1 tetratricopeptide repeat protein [Paracoccaceae bacterium]